jgi:hypothetical protein
LRKRKPSEAVPGSGEIREISDVEVCEVVEDGRILPKIDFQFVGHINYFLCTKNDDQKMFILYIKMAFLSNSLFCRSISD